MQKGGGASGRTRTGQAFQATAAPGPAPHTRLPPDSARAACSWVVLLSAGHPHGPWAGFQPSAPAQARGDRGVCRTHRTDALSQAGL